MFEEAESDPKILEPQARSIIPSLRTQLLAAQYKHLQANDRALLVLVGGIDGAGKGDTINLLNDWMDPRHIQTMAFPTATVHDQIYPPMYRFWQHLPAKGEMGIVFGSGYAPAVREASKKKPDPDKLAHLILTARSYEADLVANGIQVIKLWFHLSKKAQHQRVQALLSNASTAWKVSEIDLKVKRRFERLRVAGQRIIEATDSNHAPWFIIPAADDNMRNIRTGQAVLHSLKKRSVRVPLLHDPAVMPQMQRLHNPLKNLDHGTTTSKEDYEAQLLLWQNRLATVVRDPRFVKNHALMLVFEGQDAAGKGSTIRRLTQALDARQYQIVPVGAPQPFELDRPYLWRFWRKVPAIGRISIFDRSWYGRVLVERVERLIPTSTWQRAYSEINAFENQMSSHGIIVVKFWLAITKEEQLRRFRERERLPFKQYKITPDDWRNRRKWTQYAQATADMLTNTNTAQAPWHPLPSTDKRYARVEVLKRVVHAIESRIAHHGKS